jgi:hypothetical protein
VDRLPVLSLLVAFGKYLRRLLPLPSWGDSESVREWTRRVIAVLTEVTAQTATSLDDAAVRLFAKVVENDEAWNAFYSLVAGIFRRDDPLTLTAGDQVLVDEIAVKAGIDPATIGLILQLITTYGPMLLEWIRNRRKKDPDPQPAI